MISMSWQDSGRTPRSFKFLKFLYHLPNFLKLAWRLFRDPGVPIHRKAILVVFVIFAAIFIGVYFLSPWDLIPEAITGIVGFIDDPIVPTVVILLPGIYLFIKTSPKEIVYEHVQRIDRGE